MGITGGCMCGAVRYAVKQEVRHSGACHCGMCRKWSGGVFIGIEVAADDLMIENEGVLTRYRSSPWAERAFCSVCGSSLFYRVTAAGPHHGTYHIGMGTVDDPSGISMTEEIFIDRKPDGYGFVGDHKTMTEAEVMAMFGAT